MPRKAKATKPIRNAKAAVKQTAKQTRQIKRTAKAAKTAGKRIGKAFSKLTGSKTKGKAAPKKASKSTSKKSVAKTTPYVKSDRGAFMFRDIPQLKGKVPLKQLEYVQKHPKVLDAMKQPNEGFVARFNGDSNQETRVYRDATLLSNALSGSDSGVGGKSEPEKNRLLENIQIVKVGGGGEIALAQERKIQERRRVRKEEVESIKAEGKQLFGATKEGRTKGAVDLLADAIKDRKEISSRLDKLEANNLRLQKLLQGLIGKKSKKKVAKKATKKSTPKTATKKVRKVAKKKVAKKATKKATKKSTPKKSTKKVGKATKKNASKTGGRSKAGTSGKSGRAKSKPTNAVKKKPTGGQSKKAAGNTRKVSKPKAKSKATPRTNVKKSNKKKR